MAKFLQQQNEVETLTVFQLLINFPVSSINPNLAKKDLTGRIMVTLQVLILSVNSSQMRHRDSGIVFSGSGGGGTVPTWVWLSNHCSARS